MAEEVAAVTGRFLGLVDPDPVGCGDALFTRELDDRLVIFELFKGGPESLCFFIGVEVVEPVLATDEVDAFENRFGFGIIGDEEFDLLVKVDRLAGIRGPFAFFV